MNTLSAFPLPINRRRLLLLFAWLLVPGISAAAETQLVIHPAPPGEMIFANYQVTINGQPAPVRRAIQNDGRVNDDNWDLDYGDYGFVSFDFAGGPVELRIESRTSLDRGLVQPASAGLKPRFAAPNVAFITITRPGQFSFEPNGPFSPLLIFANPPDQDVPAANAPGVVYFGPGLHHPPGGIIELTDNQTLYLDGGAVVQAGLRVQGRNITIRGRGVLDGSPWTWRHGPRPGNSNEHDPQGRILERGFMNTIRHSSGVRVEGITVLGAWEWTFYLENSAKISFNNVKIVGGKNINDDGIDPTNSRDITVRNCFIRTADDCFALKGHRFEDGPVERMLVENCVLWSESQRIVLLGHESRAPAMRDITFRNLDVIHFGPNIGFALQPGEEMKLENITFENIRLNADGYVGVMNPAHVIDITPLVNEFMERKVPGHVDHITFRNLSVTGPERRKRIIRVAGIDESHSSRNVTFENVAVFGEPATRNASFVELGPNADGITFKR
ncbi:MAG: glycosyl hydrolase family 28 protein [Verrucomicrobiota bacterium]